MRLSKTGAVLVFASGGALVGALAGKSVADMILPDHQLKSASDDQQANSTAIIYCGIAVGCASGAMLAAWANRRGGP